MGAKFALSLPSNTAPIFSNGSVMRRIGRLRKYSSPSRINSPCLLAKKPISSLIAVPEFPQSNTFAFVLFISFAGVIVILFLSHLTFAPRACMIFSVFSVSSASR